MGWPGARQRRCTHTPHAHGMTSWDVGEATAPPVYLLPLGTPPQPPVLGHMQALEQLQRLLLDRQLRLLRLGGRSRCSTLAAAPSPLLLLQLEQLLLQQEQLRLSQLQVVLLELLEQQLQLLRRQKLLLLLLLRWRLLRWRLLMVLGQLPLMLLVLRMTGCTSAAASTAAAARRVVVVG